MVKEIMENNVKKNKFLIIGQFLLVIGLLAFAGNSFFLNNNPIIAFIAGILFGISLVFNLMFLIKNRK
jgi:hypothetical protein